MSTQKLIRNFQTRLFISKRIQSRFISSNMPLIFQRKDYVISYFDLPVIFDVQSKSASFTRGGTTPFSHHLDISRYSYHCTMSIGKMQHGHYNVYLSNVHYHAAFQLESLYSSWVRESLSITRDWIYSEIETITYLTSRSSTLCKQGEELSPQSPGKKVSFSPRLQTLNCDVVFQ